MLRKIKNLRTPRRRLSLGPADHGVCLTLEEFNSARYADGFVYEIIDGALHVSPNPIPWNGYWVALIRDALVEYSRKHRDLINHVSERSDAVIPNRVGPTRPQPDIAAFRSFPHPPPADWAFICPIVVVEVISGRRAEKDTVRNRNLYWLAEGIEEYWIVDTTTSMERPTLIALVRRAGANEWSEKRIAFGRSYRSATLPGFVLNLNVVD